MNKNAANQKQVKSQEQRLKLERETEINDLKVLLSSPHGRRVFWRILEHCKVFSSVWEASAKIHYNAGIQDVGHFILSEVLEADDQALLKMMNEAKQKEILSV